MTSPSPLFSGGFLHEYLRAQHKKVHPTVDAIGRDQFLNVPDDNLVEYVLSHLRVEPLEIYRDEKTMDYQEKRIKRAPDFGRPMAPVPAVRVIVHVPFSGEPLLWDLRPDHGTLSPPFAIVHGSALKIVLEHAVEGAEAALKAEVNSELNKIADYIGSQTSQIRREELELERTVHEAVRQRRERLGVLSKLPDALGIQLQRKTSAPSPLRRKLVRPLPAPPVTGQPSEPPGITDDDYEHILSVIRHEGITFESTPATYRTFGEEELRDILLAHLNGHYEGDATGETFRRSGKTDIRIESRARAAFVAECKCWSGQKDAARALDQLLGYLTWRDCKAALVFFNKDAANFGQVRQRLTAALDEHPLKRSSGPTQAVGEWRHRFGHRTDASREILIHVFVFDLYCGREQRA